MSEAAAASVGAPGSAIARVEVLKCGHKLHFVDAEPTTAPCPTCDCGLGRFGLAWSEFGAFTTAYMCQHCNVHKIWAWKRYCDQMRAWCFWCVMNKSGGMGPPEPKPAPVGEGMKFTSETGYEPQLTQVGANGRVGTLKFVSETEYESLFGKAETYTGWTKATQAGEPGCLLPESMLQRA